jgi:triacylglycerol esterase/lipase EstA (alpha/beta hydrolase family)
MTKNRRRRSGLKRRLIAGLIALVWLTGTTAATAATAAPASAGTQKLYPIGGLGTALTNYLISPNQVAGANDWNCRPSAAHPYPVVLVHATAINLGGNWATISPTLADAGYCVFAFNYGMNPVLSLGRIGGLTDIATSAGVLRDFVNQVLSATGADQVDVVGHSQGGMMPNYYLKRLGGAAKVHTFIGLGPSNHGTTLSGLTALARQLNILGFVNSGLTATDLPGLAQQELGSDFQTALFGDGDTVPGPRYVVIATTHDEVVTPYTNALLSGDDVTNIVLQNQCPNDPTGHIALFLDGPTIQNILNQLGPNQPGFQPLCLGYGFAA